jgi:hypothetical protein
MCDNGVAEDLTCRHESTINAIREREHGFTKIGYAAGTYGCNGYLLRGNAYGKIYAVVGHTTTMYMV